MTLDKIACLLLFGLVTVTTIGFLDRFLLHVGMSWTEELARFTMVWLSLIAAVTAMQRNAHFRIQALIERLGRGYSTLIAGICIAISLGMAWYGLNLALKFHTQTSPALGISMFWIYVAVPVAFVGMAIYLFRSVLRLMRPPSKADPFQSVGGSR